MRTPTIEQCQRIRCSDRKAWRLILRFFSGRVTEFEGCTDCVERTMAWALNSPEVASAFREPLRIAA